MQTIHITPGIRNLRRAVSAAILALAATLSAQETKLEYHGAGWFQFGRVEESEVYSVTNDVNDNWMQNAGAQLGVAAKFDERWEGGLGVGVVQVHLARGSRGQANQWYPFWVPYVAEARVSYTRTEFLSENGSLRLNLGSFGYNYNPDAKNLGVYLMRGYVYPGALVSGFGNIFGAQARYENGGFRNDLILKSETEERPIYDLSLADVVSYRVLPGLEFGAGVNFYRMLPSNKDLTSPGKDCPGPAYAGENCYVLDYSDTAGGAPPDTILGSLAGTKLMARFSLDPKALFGWTHAGSRAWGKADWVLYGEAAVIGVKDYPVVYDDVWRRVPVMIGFNFPMLGYLDYLSLEVEYYASKNSADNRPASFGSWLPSTDLAYDTKRDDWKWSVNASKVVLGNLQVSIQVANDHLRPGGTHDAPAGDEASTTPKDWYWTVKTAFFF